MNRTADRILIVDDTSASLKLLATILTKAGYAVLPADSGELALETVHNCKPDLIFLDINMPGMNGFDVLKHLRDNPETSSIPVIMISSADETENQLKGFQLGAIDFVTKPFIAEILLARVNTHLELARFRNALVESNAKLIESEERYRKLFVEAPLGIALIDSLTGHIHEVNPMFASIVGRTTEEMTRIDWMQITHHDDTQKDLDSMALLNAGKIDGFHMEKRYIHRDGTLVWINMTIAKVRSKYKTMPLHLCMIENITDRKRIEQEKQELEQRFQQSQKLESLGVLAGGIAHDFNNILAIIVGYCGLTKMDYEDAEKHIPEIEKAAERAAALCRQMLAYAGKASLSQSQINTWMLVDEMVSMLKTTIQKNVVIKPELGTDIPAITGDASQIRQVVMNLIINAAEAIGDTAGEIHVSLAKSEIKAGQPEKDHLGMVIPVGRYIRFEVTDNGCGMDDETKCKIFEPFYTTKFTGRGLGMSAVLGIIKAHNGALQLDSRLGHGTTFKVFLPVQLGKYVAEEAQQVAVTAAWQGAGTILLAEDEVQVKAITIALLQNLGFKVLDAANGKEALELYQQNAADITMVVTDMGMPVMNGYELFYKLKRLDPQLPIIITSGFGEGDIGSKIPREEIAGMINKPYNFEQLREVLRGVVEETRSAIT